MPRKFLAGDLPAVIESSLPAPRFAHAIQCLQANSASDTADNDVDGPAAVASPATAKSPGNHAASTPESDLRDALADYYPNRGLRTLLSLTYLNTPKNETLLTSSLQVVTISQSYGENGKQPASLRIAGVILNDKGKIAASFRNQLKINPVDGLSDAAIIYNDHTPLPPGIYQLRAAVRDERTGRLGSAMRWIVIPDLSTHQLETSSILLGAQVVENKSSANDTAQVQLSVDHSFSQSSRLGYWIFVYNAKIGAAGAPDLAIHSEVVKEGRVVLNGPARRITSMATDDGARIPFAEALTLESLAPGKYDLRVPVVDGLSGTSRTQEIDFDVR